MSSRLRLGFQQFFQVNNISTVALWQTVIGYFPTKRAIARLFFSSYSALAFGGNAIGSIWCREEKRTQDRTTYMIKKPTKHKRRILL
jgi:hypothetical protein